MFNNSTFNFFRSNQTQTSIFQEELYQQLNQQLNSPNISYDHKKWASSNDISYQSFLNEQEIDNFLNIQLPQSQQIELQQSNDNDKMSRQYSQQSQNQPNQKQNLAGSQMICEQENIIQSQTNIDAFVIETHYLQKNDYYFQLVQKYKEPLQTQILEESQNSNNDFSLSKLKQENTMNIDNFEITQSTKSQINQSLNSKCSEIQQENSINLQDMYNTNQNWMKSKLRKEAKKYESYKTKDFTDLLQSLPGCFIHQDEGEIRVDKIRALENEEDQYYQQFEITINPQKIIGPIKIKKNIKIHVRFKKNYSGIVYYDKQLMNKIPINQVDEVTIKNSPLILTNVSEHQVKLICCIVITKCRK